MQGARPPLRAGLMAGPVLLVACAAAPPPAEPPAMSPPACACASLQGTASGTPGAGGERLLPYVGASLAHALADRDCPAAPPATAPWRLHYQLRIDEDEQVLLQGAPLLEPRLACGAEGCRVRHDWTHQGPPGRSLPRRVTREAELRLQLHAGDSPQPAWQGRARRTLPASGASAADTVAGAARELAALLPPLRRAADCDAR